MSQIVAPWRIGIDVGGTFTDLVLIDANGVVFPYKSPSEPANPAVGVLRSIEGASQKLGLDVRSLLKGCSHFIHGTTVATNLLLERKGARVGLITTHGFRDTIEIRRGYREFMWDHRTPWQDVLVPRSLRLPVVERMTPDGQVELALDKESVAASADVFRREGVEAVAICLLHAYANDAHERACAEMLAEALPAVYITTSSSLAPIVGEFERCSTTVANAYVAPKLLPYLSELARELRRRGLERDLLLVQSNGGAISLDQIGTRPVALALSGPAAGLASLRHFQQITGNENLISIEIGGTSCDVTVVTNGKVAETDSITVGDALIALPSVEIHTIGTGGGTICGVDAGGLLFVGPQGAGAKPGPACYGFGGKRPTITDAQLILGRLHEGTYAGGSLYLKTELADAALRDAFEGSLGAQVSVAAGAIIQLSNLSIRQAIEKVSLVRGLDPAKYVLVGAGGAGALHVADVARKLGIRRAFIPRLAGVFCAFGMCNADVRHDYVSTIGAPLSADVVATLRQALAELTQQGRQLLLADGFTPDEMDFEVRVDMRYAGQQWPISVSAEDLDPAKLRQQFEAEHERIYASVQPNSAVEVMTARVSAIGHLPVVSPIASQVSNRILAPIANRRAVQLTDETEPRREVPILAGANLQPGHYFVGPAIIEEATTTILVGDGDMIELDAFGNYHIDIALPTSGRNHD
ncbi:Acetophenone carboxylase gamma subunit [Ensifer psoraleae]|uniref:hydantoinase/oxoprolinase family protein n=1 Tax=Sinorhizobium psoraleae TaxID=520838 RepID=UPI0015688A9F|nr:hydantoinase/oxoprolinase family protein [Sinorhizobium psoraleae]NRP75635.1 Acetophenone carboxylase gamma subunit [Sinorhizobium psoraleae]